MDTHEVTRMMDELDDPDSVYLNDWEATFLDSLMKQVDDDKELSDAQVAKLKEIHTLRVRRS